MSERCKAEIKIYFSGEKTKKKIEKWIRAKNDHGWGIEIATIYGSGMDLEIPAEREDWLETVVDELYAFLHKTPEVDEMSTRIWVSSCGKSFYRGER